MVYIKLFAVVALMVSIGWAINEPRWESILAVVLSISGLVTAFLVPKRTAKGTRQHQSVSESSIGVQAGRDVTIGSIGYQKDAAFQEIYKHFTNQLSYGIGRYKGYISNLAPDQYKYTEAGVWERINEIKSARLQLLLVCGEHVRSMLLEEGTDWLDDIHSFGKKAPSIMDKLSEAEYKDRIQEKSTP
jgi:hypothetical protein